MGRREKRRRARASAAPEQAPRLPSPVVPYATLLLVLAFVVPNLGALLLYRRGLPLASLGLYTLAVLSKESAAAVAGVALPACLRFDRGHEGAAASLTALEAGIPFVARRPKV